MRKMVRKEEDQEMGALLRTVRGFLVPPFFLSPEGILVNKGNIFWCEIHQR
jgi:hypothetical protein